MAQYRITPELYLDAIRLSGRRMRVVLWIFVLLCSAFVVWSSLHGDEGGFDALDLVPIPILGVAFFVALPMMERRRIDRIYSQQKALHYPMTLEIDDEGITWTDPKGMARFAWGEFYKWIPGKRLIVLFESEAVIRIIPTEILDEDQRSLIAEKLKHTKKG